MQPAQRQQRLRHVRPVTLDYGTPDPHAGFRGAADTLGGWPQLATALTLGATGALLGWLPFRHDTLCLSSFLGAVGFCVGLFLPIPGDAPGWRRLAAGLALGALAAAVGVVFGLEPTVLLAIFGFRAGLSLYDRDRLLR